MPEPTVLTFGNYEVSNADERNWTVNYNSGRFGKHGNEIQEFVGYYSDLEAACRAILREAPRRQGKADAQKIIAAIEEAKAEIARGIREAGLA